MALTLTVSRLKQLGALVIAIAVVLAAGTVVGQAPMIFGSEVADPPEASIEFTDQDGDGTSATVDTVSLSDGGFVVITDERNEIVGVSPYLESGDHENVTVEQRGEDDLRMLGHLTATVHKDGTDDETFVYEETDGEADRPYIDDGYPVSETASVTVEQRDEDESRTSFTVDAVDAPETITANGSDEEVELVATISNPSEFETRQHVELRIDGELRERQVSSLEGNESKDVTFSIDVNDVDAGNYTYGVYTTEDGDLGEFEVVGDEDANVSEADSI